jgi:hypothetical protein
MFVDAIENVDRFTRPLHMITRTYGGLVSAGTATFFFVNEEGMAITCKHVTEMVVNADRINQHYQLFKAERDALPRDNKFNDNLRKLEFKYNLKKETIVQVKNNFINCFDGIENIVFHVHATLDLAILKFQGYKEKRYDGHAVFVEDGNKVKQGRYLCRLGYPFPEFNNFLYNEKVDDIEWTRTGNLNSPKFPIDGIITRFGGDGKQIVSIEMSTPGLRGQSGGPLFDTHGLIYGMQFLTNHLHLGFDIRDLEILNDGKHTKVSNSPFLHVGHCIHVDRIREFLDQFKVKYYEG